MVTFNRFFKQKLLKRYRKRNISFYPTQTMTKQNPNLEIISSKFSVPENLQKFQSRRNILNA